MNTKKNMPVLIVTAVMLLVLLIDLIELFTPENKLSIAFSIVGSLGAIYYGLVGYKKPNGNLMKFLFFAYGFAVGLYGVYRADRYVPTSYLYFLSSAILIYISGRLDRRVQNTCLFVVAFVLELIGYICKCNVRGEAFFSALRLADELYLLLALYAFYFIRYKEHKEAGFAVKAR